jgi:hypothetical protein
MKNLKKVVLVEWIDAWSDTAYNTQREIDEHGAYMCYNVGFVLRDDDLGITMTRELSPDRSNFRYINHIPRAMIQSVTVLKEAETE